MPAPKHQNPIGLSRDVAREYLDKFPGVAPGTVARIVFAERPDVFGTLNAAQCAVRRQIGKQGKLHREKCAKPIAHEVADPLDAIPEGVNELGELDPHRIVGSRIGLMYDPHVPYHDSTAVRAAVRWWRDEQIDHLFIGGDFVDFYAISKYDKDPARVENLPWELFVARQFLEALRGVFPDIPITYLRGNHEERLPRFVASNAKALALLPQVQLEYLLDLEKYRVTLIPEHHYAQAGHMKLIHGHEFRQRSSQEPAKALARIAREAVTCGHWHRRDDKIVNTPISRDRTFSCHSIGTLGCIRADFQPFNEWTHGAGLLRVDADGGYHMDNRLIEDGEVI